MSLSRYKVDDSEITTHFASHILQNGRKTYVDSNNFVIIIYCINMQCYALNRAMDQKCIRLAYRFG